MYGLERKEMSVSQEELSSVTLTFRQDLQALPLTSAHVSVSLDAEYQLLDLSTLTYCDVPGSP